MGIGSWLAKRGEDKAAKAAQDEKSKDFAAGVFDKQRVNAVRTESDGDLANRIAGMGKLQGAEAILAEQKAAVQESGPKTAAELLAEKKGNKIHIEDSSEQINKFYAGRTNAELNKQFEGTQEKLSAQDRAQRDREEFDKARGIVGGLRNEHFFTATTGGDPHVGAAAGEAKDVNAIAAILKNRGILTDVDRSDKKQSEEDKNKQDIEDLEKIDKMVGGRLNTDIRGGSNANSEGEGEGDANNQ